MQSECTSQLESPDELEKEADNDDDDGVASVTSSVLHGAVNSSTSQSLLGKGKSKTKSGTYFRAWSFQMIVKANFPPASSSTAGEKRKFLFEHLSLRTAHNRPTCVTCLSFVTNRISQDLPIAQVSFRSRYKDMCRIKMLYRLPK